MPFWTRAMNRIALALGGLLLLVLLGFASSLAGSKVERRPTLTAGTVVQVLAVQGEHPHQVQTVLIDGKNQQLSVTFVVQNGSQYELAPFKPGVPMTILGEDLFSKFARTNPTSNSYLVSVP